ncbi:class I SAM-dependent methyltransferase [Micromonospora sp. NPDC000089]|uniref:class I SAM-dependent methyltransferase n=1 Tax=unclassified Micromonospora TaxID=2617518 RepID=UPI0036937CFD
MASFDDHERDRWTGRAEAYRRGFAALCAYPVEALLDAAGVRPGHRVLDVGCGTGTVAARAVERGATVVGVDAEASMLAVVRREVAAATPVRGALPRLPVATAAMDAAVANFVVNHVGDPAAAVAELRRTVRPGGRVAVTIWPYPQSPLLALWGEVFAGVATGELPRVPADRDFARTGAGLAGLLARAGLADVRGETLTWTHRVDPDDWWAGPAAGLGTPGLVLHRQSPEERGRLRRRYDHLVADHLDERGRLALPTAALLAWGMVG